jgi:hypothetical protein
MASPGLESYCCQNLSEYSSYSDDSEFINLHTNAHHVICILSSVCSIIGALFLILSCKNCRDTRPADIGRRRLDPSIPPGYSKRIIAWLAVADLLACTGKFVSGTVIFSLGMNFMLMSKLPRSKLAGLQVGVKC